MVGVQEKCWEGESSDGKGRECGEGEGWWEKGEMLGSGGMMGVG